MKCLILVLSARCAPWGSLMDASRETWDAEDHAQTRTLYYCGGSAAPSTISPSVFYSQLSEDLCDVSARTIEAFEQSMAIPYWDFIARVNSSCYVHKSNLVAYLETLPRENQLRGLLAFGDQGVGHQLLWGGGQYIISRDVVEQMVEHKSAWRNELMEDEAITRMAEVLQIPMQPGRSATIDESPDGSCSVTLYGSGSSFSFTDWADINKAQPHHYFRVKQDLRRERDVAIMHKLKEFYQ